MMNSLNDTVLSSIEIHTTINILDFKKSVYMNLLEMITCFIF